MPFDKQSHPFGTTLLLRDNANNRKLFPNGPFGYEDVAETVCTSSGQCPHYHYRQDVSEAARQTPIHILIASFRDRLCGRTLHNAFQHADNPKRLFIRVIDQTQPKSELEDDEGCWERYCRIYNPNCNEFRDNVKTVRVNSADSKGPTWARSRLSAMIHWDFVHRNDGEKSALELQEVQPQDFCMQVDSHMDFSDRFDTRLIGMHHRTENDYAVLSTYVTAIEDNNKNLTTVPHLCMVQFTSSIRNWATKECAHLKKPKLTNAMWGAGLSFHRCHAELNVPVDPYLDGVFDGEEGSRGIRFFTHGYDVYTPDEVLVTHDYHGHQGNPVVHTWGRGFRGQKTDDEKKFQSSWRWFEEIESHREELNVFGSKRVNMLLGIGSTFSATEKERNELTLIRDSKFGLGDKRTLEQVREFTGIDLLNERMVENKCGNLIWVPFEESPEYGVPKYLSRGHVGKVEALDSPATPVEAIPDQYHRDFRPVEKTENVLANTTAPIDTSVHGHDPMVKTNPSGLRNVGHIPTEEKNKGFGHGWVAMFLLLAIALLRFSSYKRAKDERHKN